MVHLTDWLDGLMAGPSRKTGIPREQLSAHLGGELIGTLLEEISGIFAKDWAKPVVDSIAGVIALGYGIYGKNVDERFRRELLQMGEHLALRALELIRTPAFSNKLKDFASHLATGDVGGALSLMIKTPNEVLATLGLGASSSQVTTSQAVATVTTAVPITPPPPPPAPVVQQKKSEVY